MFFDFAVSLQGHIDLQNVPEDQTCWLNVSWTEEKL